MKIIFLVIPLIFSRQIIIAPRKELVFLEEMEENSMFKFIFKSKSNIQLNIEDLNNKKIYSTIGRQGTLYTRINTPGNIKITAMNLSSEPIEFDYKCPDIDKEMIGHFGYVKDSNLVGDLSYLLDDLIQGQNEFLQKMELHSKIIQKSRKWAQILSCIEFLLTLLLGYFLHKSFINMFEQKTNI